MLLLCWQQAGTITVLKGPVQPVRPPGQVPYLPDKTGPLLPAKLALWSPAEPAPEGAARQRPVAPAVPAL